MKRILPCFLCICFLLMGCGNIQSIDEENQQAVEVEKKLESQVVVNEGIQIVARRPYIRRGDMGVLALKINPNANCRIVAVYKVSGQEYRVTRDMIAGKDGSVLCTWKVDEKTDVGTYNIVITSGINRLVTSYIVQ